MEKYLPFTPDTDTLSVPFVTVLTSPVTASTYLPFGTPVNVASPEIETHTKLSVVLSV